jgi:hypothetical protein
MADCDEALLGHFRRIALVTVWLRRYLGERLAGLERPDAQSVGARRCAGHRHLPRTADDRSQGSTSRGFVVTSSASMGAYLRTRRPSEIRCLLTIGKLSGDRTLFPRSPLSVVSGKAFAAHIARCPIVMSRRVFA